MNVRNIIPYLSENSALAAAAVLDGYDTDANGAYVTDDRRSAIFGECKALDAKFGGGNTFAETWADALRTIGAAHSRPLTAKEQEFVKKYKDEGGFDQYLTGEQLRDKGRMIRESLSDAINDAKKHAKKLLPDVPGMGIFAAVVVVALVVVVVVSIPRGGE